MPKHELFVASPGHGKTFACIERFREEILKSPSGIDSQSYFVLPNQEHAGRIQHLLLRKDMAGLFNAHILTFHELTQKLLSGTMPPRPTQALRSYLVSTILEDPSMDWSYFGSVRDLDGFQELVSQTIQEFKSSMLSIEEFEKRAQPLLKDAVFRSKFRDFSILVKRYEMLLKEMGLADAEDALLELIRTDDASTKINLIVWDGFYHFTRAQRTILEYLVPRAEKMIVTLTVPGNASSRSSVFHYCEATRNFLLNLGFSQTKDLFDQNSRTQEAALKHLEENIFLDDPRVYDKPTSAVGLIVADHVHDEVSMIAHEISKNHREKSIHFSDIAIILRSVKSYEKQIKAAFNEYGIPYFIHERGKMIENGALLFVYQFLSLFSQEWEMQTLLSLLGSTCISSVADEKELAEIQRRLMRDGVQTHKDSWIKWFEAQDDLPSSLGRFKILLQAQHALLSAATAGEFRVRLERELRALGWERSLGPDDQAAYRAFQELGKQWDAYGVSPVSMPDHLRRGIELGLYSNKPSGKNRVQIYDTVMALPKEYKIVFLAGLLEKQFPKEITEDAIFKDDERRRLNANEWVLEERLLRIGGERYFFYMALSRAREQVYLSYPLKDIEGKPHMTSFFVEEALKCFGKDTISVIDSKSWRRSSDWVAVCEAEKNVSRKLYALSTKGEATHHEDALVLARAWKNEERFGSILEAGASTGMAVFLDKRIPLIYESRASNFSATRLESYLTCAFKYFANYTLRLKEPLENRERVEMGKIIHEVLENFFKQRVEEKSVRAGFLKNASHTKSQMAVLLDEAFGKSSLSQEPLFRRNMYRARMAQIIDRFIDTEAQLLTRRNFEPRYFEFGFGGKRYEGPPQSAADNVAAASLDWGDVHIEGKIDRIDVNETTSEALISDYKLSPRELWKKIEKGLEVQLPIYVMAVEKLLGLKVVGAELRFLETDKDATSGLYLESARESLGLGPKKRLLSRESWDDIMTNTQMNVAKAAQRLKAADITIHSKSCQFCPFDSVCRFETWRLIYDEVDGG
jgi:ATP-dependent helicase/nuclease subunit B